MNGVFIQILMTRFYLIWLLTTIGREGFSKVIFFDRKVVQAKTQTPGSRAKTARPIKVPVRSNFPNFMFVHFSKDYVAVTYQAK